MKVLLITEYFPPLIHGGGELSAQTLAQELAKNNIEVHVLTSKRKNSKNYEIKDNIKIHRLLKTGENPRSLLDNIKRTIFLPKSIKEEFKKLNKKEKFDIIHFLNTTSITELKTKTKKVATINNYTNFCPKSNLYHKTNFKPGEKNFIKYLKCMFTSKYIGKQKLKPYLKYNPLFLIPLYINYLNRRKQIKYVDRFIVLNDLIPLKNSKKIYNPINIKNKLKKYPIKKGSTTFTYIGELEQVKGVDRIIKAFSNIKNAKLLIIGTGSEEKYLKKIANKNIIFTGKLDPAYIPHIYSQTDVVILPTRWPEPLSRTLTESLFFGKPIIATNKGGNTEQVKNNINGFIINNQKELIEKMDILVKNKKLRKNMGEESKKLYNKKFITNKIIKQIIELYKETIT